MMSNSDITNNNPQGMKRKRGGKNNEMRGWFKDREGKSKWALDLSKPFIIRLDGCKFSRKEQSFMKPYDVRVIQTVLESCEDLMLNFPVISTCYAQSDEVSILFPTFANNKTQKILTQVATYYSVRYNHHLASKKWDNEQQSIDAKSGKFNFDGRIISHADNVEECVENFKNRMFMCKRNSSQILHNAVVHTPNEGMNGSMLRREVQAATGIDPKKCNQFFRQGVLFKRVTKLNDILVVTCADLLDRATTTANWLLTMVVGDIDLQGISWPVGRFPLTTQNYNVRWGDFNGDNDYVPVDTVPLARSKHFDDNIDAPMDVDIILNSNNAHIHNKKLAPSTSVNNSSNNILPPTPSFRDHLQHNNREHLFASSTYTIDTNNNSNNLNANTNANVNPNPFPDKPNSAPNTASSNFSATTNTSMVNSDNINNNTNNSNTAKSVAPSPVAVLYEICARETSRPQFEWTQQAGYLFVKCDGKGRLLRLVQHQQQIFNLLEQQRQTLISQSEAGQIKNNTKYDKNSPADIQTSFENLKCKILEVINSQNF